MFNAGPSARFVHTHIDSGDLIHWKMEATALNHVWAHRPLNDLDQLADLVMIQ
jgi:hypothetical protein